MLSYADGDRENVTVTVDLIIETGTNRDLTEIVRWALRIGLARLAADDVIQADEITVITPGVKG